MDSFLGFHWITKVNIVNFISKISLFLRSNHKQVVKFALVNCHDGMPITCFHTILIVLFGLPHSNDVDIIEFLFVGNNLSELWIVSGSCILMVILFKVNPRSAFRKGFKMFT